jgi:hypothetical protein
VIVFSISLLRRTGTWTTVVPEPGSEITASSVVIAGRRQS